MRLHSTAVAAALAAFTLTALPSAFAQTESERPRFAELITWAKANHHVVDLAADAPDQLSFLAPMIGDRRLIGFGEAVHGAAEPLEFRNLLFRYLVENHGFTVVANESGFIEGLTIAAYVDGGAGEAADVAARGMTYGFGELPQQSALISWIRGYNQANPAAPSLSFHGFDVSIAPGTTGPLAQALTYLDAVADADAADLRDRLEPFLDQLWVNRVSAEGAQYTALSQAERDQITAAIADLRAILAMNEGAFTAQTSRAAFDHAHAQASAAHQADRWLRRFPVGWTPDMGPVLDTVTAADLAKLENIQWIVQRQHAGAGVLVFAHFGHIATTSVTVRLPDREMPLPPMVGAFADIRYDDAYLVIGHLIGEHALSCTEPARPAGPDTLEAALAAVTNTDFIIDLRAAPASVRRALSGEHPLFGQQPVHALDLVEGADIILFTQRASPAKPCDHHQSD